jgi:hypothetical protein
MILPWNIHGKKFELYKKIVLLQLKKVKNNQLKINQYEENHDSSISFRNYTYEWLQ